MKNVKQQIKQDNVKNYAVNSDKGGSLSCDFDEKVQGTL